jgi:serine/threonine protein kinase
VLSVFLSQDNVLISNQRLAQITDFGVARILDVEGYNSEAINWPVRYTAPELMPIDAPDECPTLQSDIFRLGILLLQVCPY